MNKLLLMPMMLCFFLVACSKTEDVKTEEVTIVGLWKPVGFGIVTDVKTAEISLADVQTFNKPLADSINYLSFDLAADGGALLPTNNKSGKDAGKYTLSSDKKTLNFKSNLRKDSTGNLATETYQVLSLTGSELKVGLRTFSTKNGPINVSNAPLDFAVIIIFGTIYEKKDPTGAKAIASAATIQHTMTFKK
jgi:hypothetical protein